MALTLDHGVAIQEICKSLAQRNCALFLGAGINAGLTNDAGHRFPLGSGLGKILSEQLPDDQLDGQQLTHIAELVEFKVGRRELNRLVHRAFSGYRAGSAHVALAHLPFQSIWTTNYDLLVEEAFELVGSLAGQLVPIYSTDRDISDLDNESIPYYKVHGSIDQANADGYLILTRQDYRFYERNRRALFGRLRRDLMSASFLFVGYSFNDPNFRAILDDCLNELGTNVPPHSFAVMRGFTPTEAAFWHSKYNVTLIDVDGLAFLQDLRDTWTSSGYSHLSAEEREKALYFAADEKARFSRIGLSYCRISIDGCSGESDAAAFYRGAPPRWADVRDSILAERQQGWDLLDTLAPELEGSSHSTVYPVVGAAGTGKTSIIKWALWQAHLVWKAVVVQHIPGTPLDAAPLRSLLSPETKRIVLYVAGAADQLERIESFIHEVRTLKLPVTLIIEERITLWSSTAEPRLQRYASGLVELSRLHEDDVAGVIDKLSAYGCLGALESQTPDERRAHFLERSEKELLVALRELTDGSGAFDELIRGEFRQITSVTARKAYALVAAVSQANAYLRLEMIARVIGVNIANLHSDVLRHTTGVLTSELTGGSRHNEGYRVRTRHPVIASIVFEEAAPTDAKKLEIIELLLRGLDLGYTEDRFLLRSSATRKRLTDCLASPVSKRSVFELLAELMPDDPYVLQHRSILERELRCPEAAIEYAQQAHRKLPKDPAINNTLGMAFEIAARDADPKRREALLVQAERIFEDGISEDPSNPYGYIGKYYVLKQRAVAAVKDERVLIEADMMHLLDDALDATNGAHQIVGLRTKARADLSSLEDSVAELRLAYKAHPERERILEQYAEALLRSRSFEEAAGVLRDGVKRHPVAWRLHLGLARALVALDAVESEVKSSYQAAIRCKKSDPSVLVEYGAYLFIRGHAAKAQEQFDKAKTVEVQTRRVASKWHWRDRSGQALRLDGKVGEIRGQIGFITSLPDNYQVRFWRTSPRNATLRQGERVSFTVYFTALGAEATIRHEVAR